MHVGATAFLGVQLQSADQGYGYGGGYGFGGGYGDGSGDGSSATGAIIANVVSGSAAEKAGLQVGDDLTAVDGTAIASVDQVSSRDRAAPARRPRLRDLHDGNGSQHTATVTLGSGPPR